MQSEFKEISEEKYEKAYSNAWSIENIRAHEPDDLSPAYIGSVVSDENKIMDFYEGRDGKYWYGTRAIVDGALISIEQYIFGRKLKR